MSKKIAAATFVLITLSVSALFAFGAYTSYQEVYLFNKNGVEANARITHVSESIGGKPTDKKIYLDIMFFTNPEPISEKLIIEELDVEWELETPKIGEMTSTSLTIWNYEKAWYNKKNVDIIYLKDNPENVMLASLKGNLTTYYGLLFFSIVLVILLIILAFQQKKHKKELIENK